MGKGLDNIATLLAYCDGVARTRFSGIKILRHQIPTVGIYLSRVITPYLNYSAEEDRRSAVPFNLTLTATQIYTCISQGEHAR